MKISVIAINTDGWYTTQLKQEADKQNIDLQVFDVQNLNDIKALSYLIGDIILFRSSSLDIKSERTAFLNIFKDKHIINESILHYPFVSHKLFQQKSVEKFTQLNFISTYTYPAKEALKSAINEGILKFPFIMKPNLGSQGKKVELVKSFEDIDNLDIKFKEFICQNFIRNSGDYRILMLGGKALGVMKRTAKEGSYLNNISQGGSAEVVTDKTLLKELTDIATSITSLFGFTMCGVDVIYNEDDKKFYFLEVNTAPQWEGFQNSTGINVSKKIIEHCKSLYDRKSKKAVELVKDYYDQNFENLLEKKFHYASRMYLTTKDPVYKNYLAELKQDYLGLNEEEIENNIKSKLSQENKKESSKSIGKKSREKYLLEFPNLMKYVKVLFLNLFAEKIYETDLRPIIQKYITDEQFLDLHSELLKSKEGVFTLSTHAVNYCYLLKFYFNGSLNLNPGYFLDVYREIKTDNSKEDLQFRIYLLTHCIIGESQFYSKQITNKEIYIEMLKELESIIYKNYFSISLDNKLEFLVCCRICEYESQLRILINQEAERSLSNLGNYVIDKLNDHSSKKLSNKFEMSEHRNVLFIMANIPFN